DARATDDVRDQCPVARRARQILTSLRALLRRLVAQALVERAVPAVARRKPERDAGDDTDHAARAERQTDEAPVMPRILGLANDRHATGHRLRLIGRELERELHVLALAFLERDR